MFLATLLEAVAEEDTEAVQRNTREQNRNLDIVGGAAGDMKRIAHVRPLVTDRVTTAVTSFAQLQGGWQCIARRRHMRVWRAQLAEFAPGDLDVVEPIWQSWRYCQH